MRGGGGGRGGAFLTQTPGKIENVEEGLHDLGLRVKPPPMKTTLIGDKSYAEPKRV